MGCDIHSVAQVRNGRAWKTVLQDVIGDPRCYDMFGMLADVRNGSGFAGVSTGSGWAPFSGPRGLPDDFECVDGQHPIPLYTPTGADYSWAKPDYAASRLQEIAEQSEVWMGDHSFSWMTLAELKTYIESVRTMVGVKCGYVTRSQYLSLRGTNRWPKEYSGGVGGPRVVCLSAAKFDRLERLGELPEGDIYVQYEWTTPYFEAGRLGQLLEALQGIADQHGVQDHDVRYVFGFDS